jgi:hypothetical protein
MWSVLERAQEGDSQMLSVAAVSVSSWHRRRWRWLANPTRNRGAGELDLEREKGLSAEREREEGSQIDGNLHRLPTIYSGSGAQQRREGLGSMVAMSCGKRERRGGGNEQQRAAREGGSGFIWPG